VPDEAAVSDIDVMVAGGVGAPPSVSSTSSRIMTSFGSVVERVIKAGKLLEPYPASTESVPSIERAAKTV
jgi:allophanate hydrolase subunit 2